MKYKLFISLAIICYCGIATTPGHNLILNGDFSGNADGWQGFRFNNCTDSDFGAIGNGYYTNNGLYINYSAGGNAGLLATAQFNITQGKMYFLQFDFLPVNATHPISQNSYLGLNIVPIYDGNDGCRWMSSEVDYNETDYLSLANQGDDFSNLAISDLGGGWKRLSAIWNSSKPINAEAGTHPVILTWFSYWGEGDNQQNLEYLDNAIFYEIPAPPVITLFNSSLATGDEPLLINFNGSAIDPYGGAMTYTLIFDTNNSALNISGTITGNTTVLGNHTYTVGTYRAHLIVSNGWNTATYCAYLVINAAVKQLLVSDVTSAVSGSGNPVLECFYNWVCTDWMPIECDKKEIMTRTCANLGTCTDTFSMPITNVSCTYVEKIKKNQLLDVKLALESNVITSSDKLTAWVSFQSFGTAPAYTNLTYSILDKAGNVIYSELDEKIIYTEGLVIKEFSNLSLAEGEYTLALTLKYANVTEKFEQKFEVGEEKITAPSFMTEELMLIVILFLGASNTVLIWHILKNRKIESSPVV